MNRRKFFKRASLASLGPLMLNGLPVQALGGHRALQRLANDSNNDRVLVLIQMHGGNDGLNTLVPLNQYDQYYNARSNIALPNTGARKLTPLDTTLPDDQLLGVQPDMQAFQRLYDNGQSAVVQSVAYDNSSISHFRGRDIWFMGGGSNDMFASGWAARYLESVHPGYPQGYPSEAVPDPLAIEIGSQVSLAFHREDGSSTAMAVDDPENILELVSQVKRGTPPPLGNSYYEQEIRNILKIDQQANQYAQRISEVYARGKNSTTPYPEKYSGSRINAYNKLSAQLRTIVRLMDGGCRTKIFLARIGGFDTHVQQAQHDDPTRGKHTALLYNMFGAVEAFQKDLQLLGLEDRVMTVTFSEFGRRVASNAGGGTDHGTAAPMFVFGKHVNPGVIGSNADLSDLNEQGNLKHQYDYRQVLGTLVKDWMQATPAEMQASRFADYAEPSLPLVGGQPLSPPPVAEPPSGRPSTNTLDIAVYPNPFADRINVVNPTNKSGTVWIRNAQGSVILKRPLTGTHTLIRTQGLEQGLYHAVVRQGGKLKKAVKLIKK